MIHELIDPKKKTNKATASKNTKAFQEPKTISEEINYEGSDSENKESSSTIFIPPWLRNSLGLNQRNNLSHSTGNSDIKSAKVNQRAKEPNHNHNELGSLKSNAAQQDCCIKATELFDILPQEYAEEAIATRGLDGVETSDNNNEKTIPIYWDVKRKQSETEWTCANAETMPPKKEETRMASTDALTIPEAEKLKEEDKKRLKLFKQKNKMRRRATGDSKQSELDKNEMDFLLETKAREALDSYMKGEDRSVSSEMRHLEAKLLLLSAKTREVSASKLNQQDLRILPEVKNQDGCIEQLERVFEHAKDVSLRGVVRNSEFLQKEKRREDKEAMQKNNDEAKCKEDKDSLLSTDDENDIKRFSEFLSKNKNVDEKRKCLEEVRNYFERKRRTRLTKRRYLEEAKQKLSPDPERKDQELAKGKLKPRDIYRGRRSKFALCDEEIVEKAVDEALQKFVELYHFRVSPNVMGNMKKNILQAITTDSVDDSKLRECTTFSFSGKKNVILSEREPEKTEPQQSPEAEMTEVPNKEPELQKVGKKRSGRNVTENSGEQATKTGAEVAETDNDKLKRLKKEFDIFLQSVQTHIDLTNLKLQSIILEKEEQAAQTQNVQFVYNFTKKALETERADYWQSLREVLDLKNRRDGEAQTTTDSEPFRRNIKIQTLEHKINCEQSLQTENSACVTQNTQTEGEGVTVQEIKELKSYNVNPGLYRMVRSKEAGKFYLYPEQQEDKKPVLGTKSNSSVVRDKKFNRKRNLINALSKERTKERQIFFKDKDRGRMKKFRNAPVYTVAQVKGCSTWKKKKKKVETRESSISCLFFRNLDKKGSGSNSSKKEIELTDENLERRPDAGEDFGMTDSKVDHLGCFWFWDGEKISPGCDLKAHVEDLLKEKLTQLAHLGGEKGEEPNCSNSAKNAYDQVVVRKATAENIALRTADALFCIGAGKGPAKERAGENESAEKRKSPSTAEEKKEEKGDAEGNLAFESRGKLVKNVSTQESPQLQFLSLSLSKHKSDSGAISQPRRKCTKRNIVIKPAGKVVNVKRAEDFLKAVQDIRQMKMELEKKENSTDSESLMDCSTPTSCYRNAGEDPLSVVLGLKENPEADGVSNADIKDRIKKLISLVDREVQTDACDAEDGNSEIQAAGLVLDGHKHTDFIGRVLSGVSQKQRQTLWNDVRNIIKSKLGKDINKSGAREVCIEIEQDMPKIEPGKVKHSIFAKGHYMKNKGDVEVEIDLTLDDLAKILRQRQKRNRRRSVYKSSKSKNLLSSSSGQSDFTRNDIQRYRRYLNEFANLQDLPRDNEPRTYKKSRGN